MALIICPECGNSVSDKAASCPHCGAPVEQQKKGVITFGREVASKNDNTITKVYIDGAFSVQIEAGKTVDVVTPLGSHDVVLDNGDFNRAEVIVLTEDKPKFTYIFKVSSGIVYIGSYSSKKETVAGRRCPKCGGEMQMQTVTQRRKMGCFTALLFVILIACTFGLALFLLLFRKKDETITYAVCQHCGHRIQINNP